MKNNRQEKSFIFLDESGKPEVFSFKGVNLVKSGVATKFLVLSVARVSDQLKIQQQVTNFRSELLEDKNLANLFFSSYTLDAFHAHNDFLEIRKRFYQFIATLDIKINILVVEKLKCFDSLQKNPGKLYGVMSGQLLKNLCHLSQKTEIIFSRKDSKLKLRQELEFEVGRAQLEYMGQHPSIDTEIRLSYYHNPHYSHGGLQIADYVSYAVFQVFEQGNRQWYEIIKNNIGTIQDICNKKYFTKSNPL